jgi:glycosyltransferase involved in cell wall biosynthesis
MRQSTPSRRRIRVCFPFVGDNVGGSHISALLLAAHLDHSRFEPIVVLHEEGLLPAYLRQQGLSYELVDMPRYMAPPYDSLRNLFAFAAQTWRIARFLRKRGIDIVHANDVRIQLGWTLATKLAQARLIWHQRQGEFGKSSLKKFLASLADEMICISDYTASTLPQRLKSRARIAANPFDTSFAETDRQAARSWVIHQFGVTPETRVVGFFGSLVERKRADVFLRAAAEIKEKLGQPAVFLVFGKEHDNANDRLTRLAAELGVIDDMRLMGFRSPIEPWIAGCDLVVAPAVREGLGRNLVEAMIVGTPVVASDTGGHKEILRDGETGFLVTPDDPTAFAAAACRLLLDPDLTSRIAERAKTDAVSRFSIAHHVEEMSEIFRACPGHVRQAETQDHAKERTPVGR